VAAGQDPAGLERDQWSPLTAPRIDRYQMSGMSEGVFTALRRLHRRTFATGLLTWMPLPSAIMARSGSKEEMPCLLARRRSIAS
jgi:hypothetical protein